jgi:hypothetical protein
MSRQLDAGKKDAEEIEMPLGGWEESFPAPAHSHQIDHSSLRDLVSS